MNLCNSHGVGYTVFDVILSILIQVPLVEVLNIKHTSLRGNITIEVINTGRRILTFSGRRYGVIQDHTYLTGI